MWYNFSRFKTLGIGLILLNYLFTTWVLDAASAITNTLTSYEYAELNNCIIPVWESSCTATLVVYGPTGMTYTVKNLTRAITSSNIITPNNYILYYDTRYAYVLKDTILGDAANRLTYWDNDLTITPLWANIASLKAVGNGSCASWSTWNGKICSPPNPPAQNGETTTSIVTLKTGNWDTVYSFDLPKNISKNYYTPDQVEKKITVPSTTSTLNITLSSTKDRCAVLPNYITDSGLSFSSNAKDYMKANLQSATAMIPVYATYSNIGSSGMSYGKISSISIGCDNYNDLVKDLIIFKISFLSPLPPVGDISLKASDCVISIWKETCISSVSISQAASTYYTLENTSRWVTMSNAFYPGWTLTITTSPLGNQAPNSLQGGVNFLNLKEGNRLIASSQATATCANGSTWNGQLCKEDAPINPLSITCSKSNYEVGESVSCKISGGSGTKMCWQTGTSNTNPIECTSVWWTLDGGNLYYSKSIPSAAVGNYTLFVKDTLGKTASTQVKYSTRYQEFITEKCTIPAGKNTCISTFYLINPIPGRSYDVKNVTRNITTKNLFTPNSTWNLPGSNYVVYKVNTALSNESANVATFGTNSLLLIDNDIKNLSSVIVASCATWSTWNWQICAPITPSPFTCTNQARLCEDGTPMPRNPNNCEWLPWQCTPLPPTTTVPLGSYTINNTSYPFSWWVISLKDTDVFSLKWVGRPGSSIYFYRVWQNTYESVWANSLNGEWIFTKIWWPTGSRVIIPGENAYKLSTIPPNAPSSTDSNQSSWAIGGFEYTIRINITPTNATNSVILEAKNCTIPIGKSTCASTVKVTSTKYLWTTWGRSFDYKNFTRNITTQNLFTPNNATVSNGGYPVYTVTTNATGDAANYAIYWVNDFGLVEWGEVIAKTTVTASCATWSSWNGQLCKENILMNPIQTGGLIPTPNSPYAKMTSCTIPEGSSTCASTLMIFAQSGKTFTLKNVTRNIESTNSVNSENFYIVWWKGVYISKWWISSPGAQQLTNGVNFLSIKENGLVPLIIQARAIARCAPWSIWSETKCIKKVTSTFSALTFETAQGTKTFANSSIISFDPALDNYLLLRWEWPVGTLQVYEWNSSNILASSTSAEATGKWQITLYLWTSQTPGNHTYTLWDGVNANTATKVVVNIKSNTTNPPYTSSGGVSPNSNSSTNSSISSPLLVEMVTLWN